jgi:hypothetical protein
MTTNWPASTVLSAPVTISRAFSGEGGERLDLLAVGLGRLERRAPGSLRHGAQAA